MKHKAKKNIMILLCFVTVIIIIPLAANAWVHSWFEPVQITEGFSPNVLNMIKNRYGITIPTDACFLDGYILRGKDSCRLILFEYPINEQIESEQEVQYIMELLDMDEEIFDSGGNFSPSYDWTDTFGGQMDTELIGYGFTKICYRVEDDRIVFRLYGETHLPD